MSPNGERWNHGGRMTEEITPPQQKKGLTAPLSVARVLQIVETLAAVDEPVSLATLSRKLGAPKSSLISLLHGLGEMNYVIGSSGWFRLGPRAYELGADLRNSMQRMHIFDELRDGMRKLNRETGETVLYGVLSGSDANLMAYGDIVETRHQVRVAVTIGEQRPLYCTAGGRMLLADRSDAEVMRYLEGITPEKLTPSTLTDRKQLLAAVQRARADGVARVSDELIDGVTGIASPVRDATGAMRGVLIVSPPTSRFSDGEELVDQTRDAARAISFKLGYREPATDRGP
jgi:DNA-binding IclR family transcriptional regulator